MKGAKRNSDFRELVYNELPKTLGGYSYNLAYDNRLDDGDKRFIFKLIFKGERTIEVFNDDWRDYTEYFRIKINGQEIKILNLDKYGDLSTAYDDLKASIIKIIGE